MLRSFDCWNTIALLAVLTFVINFLSKTHFIFEILNYWTDLNAIAETGFDAVLKKDGAISAPQRGGLICHLHVMCLHFYDY